MLDFKSLNAGSAVPTLNRNHVHSLPTAIPKRQIVEEFDRVVTPLFAKQHQNTKENTTLIEIRDALLPRLISGKLRVSGDK